MRQIALLRGVNLGPNRRLAMARLRALLADLGYDGSRHDTCRAGKRRPHDGEEAVDTEA